MEKDGDDLAARFRAAFDAEGDREAKSVRNVHDMHKAAKMGNTDFLAEYFAAGDMDVDVLDSDSWTALHLAAYWGRADAAHFLVKSGANVSITDTSGFTPLHWAAAQGHAGIVTLLLDAGADPKARDERGENPIMMAINGSHPECIKTLLDQDFNVNAHCNKGKTALQKAWAKGLDDIARMLIAKGAIEYPEVQAMPKRSMEGARFAPVHGEEFSHPEAERDAKKESKS
ncbi:unnamed protein product [Chrysoparadoxa australica]